MIEFINFFLNLTEQYGVSGIGIGMFLEGLGIPFGGIGVSVGSVSLIEQGRISYLNVVLISTVAGTIGSVVSYFIGYLFGDVIRFFKKGKLFKHEEKLNKFLKRYGDYTVFFAQLFGATRSFISLPAGIVKFRFSHFFFETLLGTLLISSIIVFLAPFIYYLWNEMSIMLGLPIYVSMALTAVFTLGLIYFYRRTIRTIRNGNGYQNFSPKKK